MPGTEKAVGRIETRVVGSAKPSKAGTRNIGEEKALNGARGHSWVHSFRAFHKKDQSLLNKLGSRACAG